MLKEMWFLRRCSYFGKIVRIILFNHLNDPSSTKGVSRKERVECEQNLSCIQGIEPMIPSLSHQHSSHRATTTDHHALILFVSFQLDVNLTLFLQTLRHLFPFFSMALVWRIRWITGWCIYRPLILFNVKKAFWFCHKTCHTLVHEPPLPIYIACNIHKLVRGKTLFSKRMRWHFVFHMTK